MPIKCPKCKWVGSNKAYMKHYSHAHYKKIAAKKKNKITVGKIPIWARRHK